MAIQEGQVFRYFLGDSKSYFEVEISEDPFVAERYHLNIGGVKNFSVGFDRVGLSVSKSALDLLRKILVDVLSGDGEGGR